MFSSLRSIPAAKQQATRQHYEGLLLVASAENARNEDAARLDRIGTIDPFERALGDSRR